MWSLAPPIRDAAGTTADWLLVTASVLTACGVIAFCLRKIRKVRPVAWLERQLVTEPIARKRHAANERITTIVNDAVTRSTAPLKHSIDDLRRENDEQHTQVVQQLTNLTLRVANLETNKEP